MDARMTRRSAFSLMLVSVLMIPTGPVLAQDASPMTSPSPSATPMGSPGSVELSATLPTEVAGRPMEVLTFSGEDMMANADLSNPEQAQDVEDFEALLAGLGASIDQVSISTGSAFDEEGGVIVFAVQIEGVDASTFMEPWMVLYSRGDYDEPQLTPGELGGKEVLLLTDAASSTQTSYGYGSGDSVWIVLGDEASIVEVLEALP